MKNEPDDMVEMVKLAQNIQYQIDEGFYDPENADKVNYMKGQEFELDDDCVVKLEQLGSKLAELAKVSQEAAKSATVEWLIQSYMMRINNEAVRLGLVPGTEEAYRVTIPRSPEYQRMRRRKGGK